MKMRLLAVSIAIVAAITALGQDGVVQDVKHGAKKAGETIKDGLETVGEKTKDTAKTVGRKTKETAQTVGEKTKETGQTVVRKTKETVNDTDEKATHGSKTHRTSSNAKAQSTEEHPVDRAANTPSLSPTP